MDLLTALKAVGPAVGDGKIVAQHAYVRAMGHTVTATNGKLWAMASLDEVGSNYVARHAPLLKALDREGAVLHVNPDTVRIQCGRSRITLKTIDGAGFPAMDARNIQWTWHTHGGLLTALKSLFKFCPNQEGHIWQQGVHFQSDTAFAANSHAMACYSHGWGLEHPFTLPPWAIEFLLAREDIPETIIDMGNVLAFTWPGLTMISTKLIEEPPANIVNFATNLAMGELQEITVGLKEAVERAHSYGIDKITIGDGELMHRSDEIEIREDVDIHAPPKVWGTKSLLGALELATHINLEEHPAKWKGGAYTGAFSGLSSDAPARTEDHQLGPSHHQIIRYLRNRDDGATDEEMQTNIPMTANTQRPRRGELEAWGEIVNSGSTRLTQAGRDAVIWRLP